MNLKYPKLTEAFLREEVGIKGRRPADVAAEIGCTRARLSQVLKQFQIELPDRYIGKKFGKLKVLSLAGKYRGANRYRCECECGKVKVIIGYSLAAENGVKSCGCLSHARGADRTGFAGYEGITGTYWGRILHNAEQRRVEITISMQDAWNLFVAQKGLCAYTGIELLLPKDSYAARRGNGCTASIDRIDPTKGYVAGNIQWVHKVVNIMKLAMSHDDFIAWCRLIAAGAGLPKTTIEQERERLGGVAESVRPAGCSNKPEWLRGQVDEAV